MKAVMYHYVRESDPNLPFFRYLDVDNFRRQLDYFESQFGFSSYEDLCDVFLNDGSFSKIQGKVVLTFDDGFTDHFSYVLPELLNRGLFGIFYIPTGVYQFRKSLDVHRIQYLLGKFCAEHLLEFIKPHIEDRMISKPMAKLFNGVTYRLQDNDEHTKRFKELFNYDVRSEYITHLLDKLVDGFCSDEEIFDSFYMSPLQIKEMQDFGMIIGSHSVNHRVFSKLSENEQASEINDSFDFLEGTMGKSRIKTFCYPYGGFHTFNSYTENLLNQAGCNFSFNVEQRDVTETDIRQRPQALPRYDCNQFKLGRASVG